MTYCAGTGTPLATTLGGISLKSILIISPLPVSKLKCSCPSHPSLKTLIGTIFMSLLFISIRVHMFLCIVYANAFQRSYINNIVYNVKYFYLAFA
jgi:hypothetical protein